MKTFYLPIFLLAFLFTACNSSEDETVSDGSNDVDTIVQEKTVNENFLSLEKWDSLAYDYNGKKEYYIISYAGQEKEEDAIAMVDSLKPNYPKAGYLWIPDFASLSGKELYAVFLNQSAYDFEIMESYQAQKSNNKGTYVVRVNQNEERWEAYSPIDIRINGERQKMILIYARPEDEEAYAEEGGEDWGWFVNDVGQYFADHHPEVEMGNVYGSGLLPQEIEEIENKLELGDDPGFGYVFINGSKMGWAGHDMPKSVIFQACEFFEFPLPD